MAFLVACYPHGGKQVAAFVGPLDALIGQGATLLYAGSVRRLLAAWSGNSMRLQGNGTGTPIAAIPFLANGDLDLTAAAAAASAGGGTAAAGETLYDQSGRLDATQTTTASQPPFSATYEGRGALGDAALATSFLNLNLGTLPTPSFVSVCTNVGGITGSRNLLGTSASATQRFCRLSSATPQQNWGTTLAGTNIATGKHLFGFLVNGASSKIYIDGSLNATGDAGTTSFDMSGGRIGAASAGTTNWFNTTGNTISEMIIFASDPTGLAGWPAFVAAQKAYFGIA